MLKAMRVYFLQKPIWENLKGLIMELTTALVLNMPLLNLDSLTLISNWMGQRISHSLVVRKRIELEYLRQNRILNKNILNMSWKITVLPEIMRKEFISATPF